MESKYRGLSYKTPIRSIPTQKTAIIAKYRGVNYFVNNGIESIAQSLDELIYRGQKYNPRKINNKISNSKTLNPVLN